MSKTKEIGNKIMIQEDSQQVDSNDVLSNDFQIVEKTEPTLKVSLFDFAKPKQQQKRKK